MRTFLASTLLCILPLSLMAQSASNAHSKAGRQSSAHKVKHVVIVPVEPEAALTPVELEIAQRVHVGKLPCELGASVTLEADPQMPGYFNLQLKNLRYRMIPVATTTGAIRLEDRKAGALWLQLANKSMLINHKLGQRMVDACMSPAQVAMAKVMEKNPPPSVLDAPAPEGVPNTRLALTGATK